MSQFQSYSYPSFDCVYESFSHYIISLELYVMMCTCADIYCQLKVAMKKVLQVAMKIVLQVALSKNGANGIII